MAHRLVRSIAENQEPVTCSERTAVIDAARLMQQKQSGAVLVVREGRLIGIFTERDALYRVMAAGRDPQTTRVSEVMTRNPQTISPEKPFGHALHMMYEGGYRHVPVVEDDRLIGVVTARDSLGLELKEFLAELERREEIQSILA